MAGAGGADERDAPVLQQAIADAGMVADHQSEDAAPTMTSQHAVTNLLHRDGGQRSLVRGLPDHTVAANSGDQRVPRPNGDRKVERGDNADQAERMPLLVHAMLRPLALH